METFCSFCLNECNYKIVNEGIGHYEYWGAKEYDEKLAVVSRCCHEPCLDENNHEINPQEIKEYEEYLKAESKGDYNEKF